MAENKTLSVRVQARADRSQAAISQFKKDVQEIADGISVDIKLNAAGQSGELKKQLTDQKDILDVQNQQAAALELQVKNERLATWQAQKRAAEERAAAAAEDHKKATTQETLAALKKQTYEKQLQTKETKDAEKAQKAQADLMRKQLASYQKLSGNVYTMEGKLNSEQYSGFTPEQGNNIGQIKQFTEQLDKSRAGTKEFQADLDRLADMFGDLSVAESKFTGSQNTKTAIGARENAVKALSGSMDELRGTYGNVITPEHEARFNNITESLKNGTISAKDAEKQYKALSKEIETLGKRSEFTSKLISRLKNFLVTAAFSAMTVAVKQATENVISFDKVLTDMQVITHKSDASMRAFGNNALQVAKNIKASAVDIVDAATVYARLGYSSDDSLRLSELTTQFSRVANVNISAAEDNLTAVIKAFDVNVEDVESVLDKLVTVGNQFPISAAGIGEGMQNAASALSAGGNSLEQATAMLMAANTTAQDPSRASTGLRTISARIRTANAAEAEDAIKELEELGEEIETLDNAAIKYQADLNAYTGGVVQLTDEEGFRSTYEILNDLSKVWGNLSSEGQAVIVKDLAGVRQQDIFYSLMKNWSSVNEAIEAQSNSIGELQTATSIWADSVQGRLKGVNAAFQSLSNHLIDSETVKLLIGAFGVLLNVLDAIAGNPVGQVFISMAATFTTLGVVVPKVTGYVISAHGAVSRIIELFKAYTATATGAEAATVAAGTAAKGTTLSIHGLSGALTILEKHPMAATLSVLIGLFTAAAIAVRSFETAIADASEQAGVFRDDTSNMTDAVNQIYGATEVNQISDILGGINEEYKDQLKNVTDINKARERAIELLMQERQISAQEYVDDPEHQRGYDTARFSRGMSRTVSISNPEKLFNYKQFTGTYEQIIDQMQAEMDRVASEYGPYDELTGKMRTYYDDLKSKLKEAKDEAEDLALIISTFEGNRNIANGITTDKTLVQNYLDDLQSVRESVEGIYAKDIDHEAESQKVKDSYAALEEAAKEYGISVDEYILQSGLGEYFYELGDDVNDVISKFARVPKTFEEIIEAASEVNSALTSQLQDFVDSGLESLNGSIDKLQENYMLLSDAVEQYNKYQALDLDTLQEVVGLSYEYISTLSFENGQLKINQDMYRNLIIARGEEMKVKIVEQAITELLALATEDEQAQKLKEGEVTAFLLDNLESQKLGYQALTGYVIESMVAEGARQELYGVLSSEENQKRAEAIWDAAQKKLQFVSASIDQASSSVTNMKYAMGGYEEAAKDANNATDALEDSLKAELKQLKAVGDELDDQADLLKMWGQVMVEAIEGQIDVLKEKQDALKEGLEEEEADLELYVQAAQEALKERIEQLNAQKEALDELYEEEDKEYQLMKARQELEEAMANKNVRVYTRDEGWTWQADPAAVKSAQENLDSIQQEQSREDAVAAIQDEIDKIQELIDKYAESAELIGQDWDEYQKKLQYIAQITGMSYDEIIADIDAFGDSVFDNMQDADRDTIESIDSQIEQLESLKDKYNEAMDLIGMDLDEYNARLAAQAEISGMSFDQMSGALSGYTTDILANMDAIYQNAQAVEVLQARIDALSGSSSETGTTTPSSGGGGGSGSFGGGGEGSGDSEASAGSGIPVLVQDLGLLISSLGQAKLSAEHTGAGMMALEEIIRGAKDGTLTLQNFVDLLSSALRENYTTQDLLEGKLSEYVTVLNGAQLGVYGLGEAMGSTSDGQATNAETTEQNTEVQQEATDALSEEQEQWVSFGDEVSVQSVAIIYYIDNIMQKFVLFRVDADLTKSNVSKSFSDLKDNVGEYAGDINGYVDAIIGRLNSMASAAREAKSAIESLQKASGGETGKIVGRSATGTYHASEGLYVTQEQGNELMVRSMPAVQGKYTYLSDGDGVLPADLTRTLYSMADNPTLKAIAHNQRLANQVGVGGGEGTVITIGDIYMNGVNDVESFANELKRSLPVVMGQHIGKR